MGGTEETTHISEACHRAVLERGVLLNDGLPAGFELMQKDVVRIALIDTDASGAFPDDFVNRFRPLLGQSEVLDAFTPALDSPHGLPKGMRDIVRDAFSHWHSGHVVFVSPRENADITVFGFSKDALERFVDDPERTKVAGFATLPPNDHTNNAVLGGGDPIIHYNVGQLVGINIDFFDGHTPSIGHFIGSFDEDGAASLNRWLKHEFGHSFGLLSMHNVVDAVPHISCDSDEYAQLNDPKTSGIMAYGDGEEARYDRDARKYISTGVLPIPGSNNSL